MGSTLRKMLLVTCAVAAISAMGFPSLAKSARPAKSPAARCAITAVKLTARLATATGGCRSVGKAVPSKWTWTATGVDADGIACGSPTHGTGLDAYLNNAAPYRLTVAFHLMPAHGHGAAASKSSTAVVGSPWGSCATLTSEVVPPASVLCTWTDNSWVAASANICGAPAKMGPSACAWTRPLTLAGTTVSAGRFACVAGDCRVFGLKRSSKTGVFQQAALHDGDFFCGPKELDIGMVLVGLQLTDKTGQTCGTETSSRDSLTQLGRETITGSFSIPAGLGGTLRVAYLLKTAAGGSMSTAEFNLPGDAGCSAFTP